MASGWFCGGWLVCLAGLVGLVDWLVGCLLVLILFGLSVRLFFLGLGGMVWSL